MLPQCALLARAAPALRPAIVLAIPEVRLHAEEARARGVDVIELTDTPGDPVEEVEKLWRASIGELSSGLRDPLSRDRLAHGFPTSLWRALYVGSKLKICLRWWCRRLVELDAGLLMMPGDRELGFVPPLLRAALDLGLPTVISTSNIPTADSLAANRRGLRRFALDGLTLTNRLVALRYPGQVSTTFHGSMLFSPGWLTLTLGSLGMLSRHPWTQGAGNSRFILVDGNRKLGALEQGGTSPNKIQIVGDLAYDELHAEYLQRVDTRTALANELGFDVQRPIVIFAVPIYGEHGIMPMPEHLAALRAHGEVLARRKVQVALSLHPRSRPENYSFLQDLGFRFSRQSLVRILPAGDFMIVGNSSTIDWGILCGLPVINLDYANIRDTAFADCGGVIAVGDPVALDDALQRVLTEPEVFIRLQGEKAEELTCFDGRSNERFVSCIRSLAGQ